MRALVAALLGILLLTTAATAADERPAPDRLDWETGDGKSYWIPALEVTGFIFSLNAINRGLFGAGDERPDVWRELAAALISPSTGFNRLVFGERFKPVFPSRDPEIFIRLRVGATVTSNITNEDLPNDAKRQEASLDYSITYGLPGKPGYRYRRPFDYFHFEFTAVPNATSVGNAIENVAIRGLLVGESYEWGPDYRGVWGLFGGYDYLSPQVFPLASPALS